MPPRHRYAPVSATDSVIEQSTEKDERTLQKEKWVENLNWLWRKIQSIIWIGLGGYLFYESNVIAVVSRCKNVHTPTLWLAIICLFFNLCLLSYLSIVGSNAQYIESFKKLVPWMTFTGVASIIFISVSLWPLFGWLILLMELSFFLGYVNLCAYFPINIFGSFMSLSVIALCLLSPSFIPHEGHLHYPEHCLVKV